MIVDLTAAHLPMAQGLLARAGLPSGVANVARYLRWQPDGAWGDVEDGVLRGMVTLLRFGAVGFVGCMAVEPSLQGAGIGRRLLERAHERGRASGVVTFLLEATPSGKLLYDRCGYVVERESSVLGRVARSDAPLAEDARGVPADLRERIGALDRWATGSDRRSMLDGLLSEAPVEVVEDGRGEVIAFGLRVGDRLGPLIARDVGAGRELVDRLEAGCTVAGVPLANEAAIAALEAHGFRETRRLSRMRLGPEVPTPVEALWAMASAGAG